MGNSSIRVRAAALAFLFTLAAEPITAQVPTAAQARQLLRDNPELARQQLLQSGLSQAEIRARLTAAGLPANALDTFFSGRPLSQADTFDGNALLGLEVIGADGLEVVEVTSGMQARARRREDVGFPIFGHDVFTRASSQFQPLLSGPVPDDYQVGPGDRMVLILTGEVELAHDLGVTREGFVVVPAVGKISVANLTMAELRVLFRNRLADSYSGVDRGTTTVDITITELRTNQIYVIGEVEQPGAYQLASVATVTNALYAAAGPTTLGNLRDVRVSRREGDDLSFDLYPYLLEGEVSGDIVLEQGDVVFVPLKSRRVQVHGSVVRPAHYELTEAEDLFDILEASGGFSPEANRKRITIHRVIRPAERGPGLGDRVAIDLALTPSTDPTEPGHHGGVVIPPIGLQDGDSIVVDDVVALRDGYHVTIRGMVAQPDIFPWHEGMTIRDLMDLARGPTVGADLRVAEVSRLPDTRAAGKLVDLILAPLDSSYLSQTDVSGRYVGPPGLSFPPPDSSPEFILVPYDQVLILSQPGFVMPTRVNVTGEVSVPGSYTLLTKSDRVTDLIDRSGAILTTGYVEGALLSRSLNGLGRIDLDLAEALRNPGGPEDIVLRDGDALHIPAYSPTVIVRGAVNSPITVLYRYGQDFHHYVDAAGGYRSDADKSRISVRYANGIAQVRSKFLFWSSYPEPGPSSVISVPAKDPADRLDKRGMIADLVGILGSVATMIVLLTR